jgi:hypothetical protein
MLTKQTKIGPCEQVTGGISNRRQDLALPKFNQRMRKQLRGTAKRELSVARDLLICISEDQ